MMDKDILSDVAIGDAIDLDSKAEFPCSDGSSVITFDCHPIAQTQYDHMVKNGWAKLDPDQKTPDYSHPTKEDRASAHCCEWWDIDWYIAGQSQRESDLKHAGWRKVKEAQDD